jgi:regulator of sirC expression with transglutaminase-like and TPR domain
VRFLRAALQNDAVVTLDAAALDLATIENPALDPAPYLQTLDAMAAELASRAGSTADGRKFVRILNEHLIEELGFHGNNENYEDPRNSCLDQVLERRTGIPITLSVVYIEVARRLGWPIFGIGLPGHFVVQYEDSGYSTFIDPFHEGKLLTREDCGQLAREVTGVDITQEPEALAPVGARYILVRMLNNLRSSYFKAKNYGKAAVVMDLLIEAFPQEADYYKARGVARLQLRAFRDAKRDLELYLKFSPGAEDRAEVTRQLESIHRWLGRLN